VAAFLVMSNELSTPKILICTSDANHTTAATNFSPQIAAASGVAFNVTGTTFALNNGNLAVSFVSYFLCGDAAEAYPQMIITGDRNIGQANPQTSSGAAALKISGTNAICYTAGNGVTLAPLWGWTANDLGIADGSVQQVTCSGLQTSLQNATNGGATINPVYNVP
jgi:hypothetical protein